MPGRAGRLREVPLLDLASDLLARLREGEGFPSHNAITSVGTPLLQTLAGVMDVHSNRFSRQRYRDMFGIFHTYVLPRSSIEGATYVDLGCGSVNPFGMLFMFLVLGAARGIAVDLDEIQDPAVAARAVADLAGMLLVDPGGVVGDYPVTREEILRNVSDFDLAALNAGDLSGADNGRLAFQKESVYELSITDGEADFVFSNTFLEHVDRIDQAVAELARITKKGGLNVHNIDVSDHRRYGSECHPLAFCAVEGGEGIVFGSNRLRIFQFLEIFRRSGFEVTAVQVFETVGVPDFLRHGFAEPFRSMRREDLEIVGARIIVKRI